jgi:hypothetical protein
MTQITMDFVFNLVVPRQCCCLSKRWQQPLIHMIEQATPAVLDPDFLHE